ncbi:MAG: glycosyltransferase [Pirellula sp.]|nr:glycosyltransferase [Pirellula sp.]
MSQGKPHDQRGDALRFTTVRSDASLDASSRLLSIIVPLYNEEENVDPLCTQLLALADKIPERVEIILVDDGSRDGTPAAVARWAAQDARIKSIQFRRNFGQTAAMMAGIDAAQGDILIPMDGDLQNDPADIPRLVAKLDEGFDVVSGWRKDRQDEFLRRTLPSRCANVLVSWVGGVPLHDFGCSLKAYRRKVIKDVKLYGEMHRFVPIYASWQGARVTELPVGHHPRRFGKSKYGLERTFKLLLDLMVVKFLAKYLTKPIYVFGGFAILSFASAGLASVASVYLKLVEGVSFLATPLPLIMTLTTISGCLGVMMGLLAELLTRTYFESQAKPVYLVERTLNLEGEVVPHSLAYPSKKAA